MQISEELAQKNLESWGWVTEFYEDFISLPNGKYVGPLQRLVKLLAKSEQAKFFRAGQSLWHLMISTAEKHGLSEDDPFVYVTLDFELMDDKPAYKNMKVGFNRGRNEIESQTCSEEEIMTTIEPFLQRLWNETRGQIGNYYE